MDTFKEARSKRNRLCPNTNCFSNVVFHLEQPTKVRVVLSGYSVFLTISVFLEENS